MTDETGALAEAIRRIEKLEGNEIYRKAWKKAAGILKDILVKHSITRQSEKNDFN